MGEAQIQSLASSQTQEEVATVKVRQARELVVETVSKAQLVIMESVETGQALHRKMMDFLSKRLDKLKKEAITARSERIQLRRDVAGLDESMQGMNKTVSDVAALIEKIEHEHVEDRKQMEEIAKTVLS